MVCSNLRVIAVAVCLVCVLCFDEASAQDAAGAAPEIEGLWSGFWGGGARDGVVFQPVLTELFIKGDQIEMQGFRNVSRLAGTVRFDAGGKRMRITPAAAAGEPAAKEGHRICV